MHGTWDCYTSKLDISAALYVYINIHISMTINLDSFKDLTNLDNSRKF